MFDLYVRVVVLFQSLVIMGTCCSLVLLATPFEVIRFVKRLETQALLLGIVFYSSVN